MKTIVIVGGSLAGVRSAQALRTAGFDGRLVLLGEEDHRPYDRPPLSKAFLEGRQDEADIALLDDDDLADLDVDLRPGTRAESLDAASGQVLLADGGGGVPADGVVVATGGTARRLPGTEGVEGVHTLRTLDDARALRDELGRAPRVVIIGAGFIGAEVASTCRALDLEVTVLDGLELPLAPALGATIARTCVALHAEHGTTLHAGTAVAGLSTASTATGRRVTGVALGDGRTVPADVVLVGVGIVPNTAWLEGSGLKIDNGVQTDAGMVTAVPTVVAVGDVARWSRGTASHRHEHWTSAGEQAAVAATNLLAGTTTTTVAPSGYVWSEQYGRMLQLAGHPSQHDDVEVVHGATDDRRFVARYTDGAGTTTGLFAMAEPKMFARLRRSELPRPGRTG